jgi:CDP-glycerol glycerophosphotransferase
MPRNDLLVNGQSPHIDRKVRAALGIDEDAHILLYAPTYREDRQVASYFFDIEAVREALVQRFGGTWTIVFRLHYLIAGKLPASSAYVDASGYDDMQELLYASSVLVTDYSSSIWDFGLTGRPCFLFTPDLDDYDQERGFYSDIHTWPWPLAQTDEEFVGNIESFDEQDYARKLAQHYEDLGSTDTGHACETVVAWLREQDEQA